MLVGLVLKGLWIIAISTRIYGAGAGAGCNRNGAGKGSGKASEDFLLAALGTNRDDFAGLVFRPTRISLITLVMEISYLCDCL